MPTAAMLHADVPSAAQSALLDALRRGLGDAGFETIADVTVEDLGDPTPHRLQEHDLLLVSSSADLPLTATAAVDAHLRRGGRLLALDAPLWRHSEAPEGDGHLDDRVPRVDLLAPSYKYFDVTDSSALRVSDVQCILAPGELPLAAKLRSPHPRARGGFDKGRGWRWIPLIESRSSSGGWSGAPASLMAHFDGPYRGAVIAAFGVEDPDWYQSQPALDVVGQLARWMVRPTLMLDGGADKYTYFDDQEIVIGMRAGTFAGATDVVGRISISERGSDDPIMRREWPVTLTPDHLAVTSASWRPTAWPADGFVVTAELVEDGCTIDRLVHDVHVWSPPHHPRFVTVEAGEFSCAGERWRPHGVNYMPSSGVATEDFPYFHEFLGRQAYDPDVIERDLDHIAEMGLNSVSIFTFQEPPIDSQNLVDLLRRLALRGMKASVNLRPGLAGVNEQVGGLSALDDLLDGITEMISRARLAEQEALFAYDFFWEPRFGSQDERRPLDEDWHRWVVERYGSVAHAEDTWGHPIPRDAEGAVTNPSADQLEGHGPWAPMVAAYRRFLDTILHKRIATARERILHVDPNHLVSFRMWEAGNPEHRSSDTLPYDFPYLAGAVDFLAPEAYGRTGDWERVKSGRFTSEWARLADPTKPVIWSEVGRDVGSSSPTDSALQRQGDYFDTFHRMMLSSGANGIFYWFFPGGFRPDDDGRDYGILNPDGTDRPATAVICSFAPTFAAAPSAMPITTWIDVDRDRRAEGLVGVYDEVQADFWAAVDAGLVPGLRTLGSGTDSATCPLLAVGNTTGVGPNPPKFLDAAFGAVEINDGSGGWQRVTTRGTVVDVTPDAPIVVRATATNLGEATWLAGESFGSVCLLVQVDGRHHLTVPLRDSVGPLASATLPDVAISLSRVAEPTDVVMRLVATTRTDFGEAVTLTLRPSSHR